MSRRLRAHPRISALVLAVAVAFSVFTVAAVRSRGGEGCAAPPPVAQLPAVLRSLGDFDQPYAANETRTLQDAAVKAAAASHGDLAGGSLIVGDAIDIAADGGAGHDAIVIPLGSNVAPGGGAPRTVEALVSFLRDCRGQAYFGTVLDLAAIAPRGFPAVTRETAARLLGSQDPSRLVLVYSASPFQPRWSDPGTGRQVSAQPPFDAPAPSPAPGSATPTS